MKEDMLILPINTPVAIVPYDWLDLIDRRSVFNPQYGIIVGYSQKKIVSNEDNSEYATYSIDVQLKSGRVVSVAGFKHDQMGVFDKIGFIQLIKEKVDDIENRIKGLQFEIADTESFVSRIPENAEFIKAFWTAQLASLKQSVKFLSKKMGRLEDLSRKVSRKLEKMDK
jgi:hypothetical protein